MAHELTVVTTTPVTIRLKVRIVLDGDGNSPFVDDSVVESDVAIASLIWAQAGVVVRARSIHAWPAAEYFHLVGDENAELRAEDWDIGQDHIDVYYVESTDLGAGWGSGPRARGGHAICLEDREESLGPEDAAAWRGIALAHEIGHYFGLRHTHAQQRARDATYDDGCWDTALADPQNLMTQGSRGRTRVAEDIHLSGCQITRARRTLFSMRADLVADMVTGMIG